MSGWRRRFRIRLGSPWRVFIGTYREREGRDVRPCGWCKEPLFWSLEEPRTTARVGKQVHAECLNPANEDEEARQSWQ